jgi:hypothetical protein
MPQHLNIPSPPRRRGPRFWLRMVHHRIYSFMQIEPTRIHLLNNPELPCAIPFLELFFSLNCFIHRLVMLVPYKIFQAVFLSEAAKDLVLVVPNPVPKRAGYADIHGAAIAVRHNVDRRKFFGTHLSRSTQYCFQVNQSGAPAFAGVTVIGFWLGRYGL